ncbi:MAG: DNA repair protein RadC [Acidaminococcaceae bacterium]|nr:DNA repair protein RadC [Acidaminococcaceae bacterium]
MTLTIKELNYEDRPREKLYAKGATELTDSELIAILLRTGTRERSALRIAEELTAGGGLVRNLARYQRVEEFASVKGIGKVKAATILAALELGRRVACASAIEKEHITSPRDGAQYLMGKLRNENHEKFYVVLLDTKNKVLEQKQIAEGSLTCAVVHPREVYAPAVLRHAAAILVAHNHPSGDPRPSEEDRELTRALVRTGEIMGIPLLDHVVIGDGRYYSFKEHHEL